MIATNDGISAEIVDIKKSNTIQTTNGGIIVYINSLINADIEITTINGDISVEDIQISIIESSSKYFKGTIGNGGNTISITTTNGGIKVYELEI